MALVVASFDHAAAKPRRSAPIPDLTADGKPNVQADGAVVIDADSGDEIFGKAADTPRHIASTGKIFVALLVRRKGIDLDATTEITRVDAEASRGGARTRLDIRHSFTNRDLLRAMLVASDNRAPSALGRAIGLDRAGLIKALNQLAKELGLRKTRFTSRSGLRGNTSTPREMAVAMALAMKDPVLAEIMSTRDVEVRSIHSRPLRIHYHNTNRVLHSQRFPVTGGKTGFTDAAGYCLVVTAKIGGRNLSMAFLGTREKLTRYGDFNRVAKWFARTGGVAARSP